MWVKITIFFNHSKHLPTNTKISINPLVTLDRSPSVNKYHSALKILRVAPPEKVTKIFF
jgi:hypothetical protein